MSTLRVNTLQDTAGVERYTARAWVNFNGTGTVAIRAAGNVSSITDNGVGDYTVNFTSAMADASYSVSGMAGETISAAGGVQSLLSIDTMAAGSVRVYAFAVSGSTVDREAVCLAIFR